MTKVIIVCRLGAYTATTESMQNLKCHLKIITFSVESNNKKNVKEQQQMQLHKFTTHIIRNHSHISDV